MILRVEKLILCKVEGWAGKAPHTLAKSKLPISKRLETSGERWTVALPRSNVAQANGGVFSNMFHDFSHFILEFVSCHGTGLEPSVGGNTIENRL